MNNAVASSFPPQFFSICRRRLAVQRRWLRWRALWLTAPHLISELEAPPSNLTLHASAAGLTRVSGGKKPGQSHAAAARVAAGADAWSMQSRRQRMRQ